jgi:hypothetical protein
VAESLRHWVVTGAGAWSGWCVPWAATLCARCGMPDAAVAWMHWWADVFTNVGRGTLHNADFPGASAIWGWPRDESGELREIMQMDAGMGAVTAVQELLVQCLGGALIVLPALPRGWRSLSFDGIWAEGGFRVGATVEAGVTQEVRVEATRAGRLRLRHGLGAAWEVDGEPGSGPELIRDMRAGERVTLRRTP